MIAGHGNYIEEKHNYALKTGDLFIVGPGVVHEITSLKSADLDLYFMQFTLSPEEGSNAQKNITIPFIQHHLTYRRKMDYLKPQFESLYRLFREPTAAHRIYFHDQLLHLLALQILGALTQEETEQEAGLAMPIEIQRATKAIDSQLDGSCKISTIAKSAGASERTLRRRFHDYFGHSITEEIRRRRMIKAAHLLAHPEWTVAEVGQQLGIDDPAQFTRMFKSVMGTTPKKFRSNNDPSFMKDRFMQTEFV